MDAQGKGRKGIEASKNNNIARRLAYLRNARFQTEGFGSNEPTPSLADARKMASKNLAAMREVGKTPSVGG